MADGDLIGRRSALAHVAHTDSASTVVCSLTLPSSVDGYFHILARAWGGTATATNNEACIIHAVVRMDAGSATLDDIVTTGSHAYVSTLTTSGAAVRVEITAANGHHSGALIEAYGFELAITPA